MSVEEHDYVYKDYSLHSHDFINGIRCLRAGLNQDAHRYFQLSYESVKNSDVYHNKYASFCGLLRLLHGDHGGLTLCRNVARGEIHDGDVYLNLARAEWFYGDRKKTVCAILKGLEIDETHMGLLQIYTDLGVRDFKPIPWISRKNILNVWVGRLLRKRESLWDGNYPFRF
ncbi:MAG: hypothetical protein COA54_08825 [Thiotrichaceae bacterium]|nr:MAG: hypothetical protein COA54_08825 [Thiotrichaceae bacterium]